MFVKLPKVSDLIRIPAHFVRLVDVHENGDLKFEVRHQIRQSDIVKRGAQIVRVTVSSRITPKIDVLHSPGQVGYSSAHAVRNILTLIPSTRSAIRNNNLFLIATRFVDNTSKLDTNLIADLKRIENPRNVAGLYKQKLMLKSGKELSAKNDIKPILQVNRDISEETDSSSFRNLAQRGIMKDGFDPSHISKIVDSEILTPRESVSGVFLKSHMMNAWETKAKYFKKFTHAQIEVPRHTSDIDENENVLVIETVFSDDVEIVSQITLPIDRLTDSSNNWKTTFFKFELLQNGLAIQTIQENVDILHHIEAFYTPKVAPIVEFARFETTGRANIQVRQMDPHAISVRVYKKDFFYNSSSFQGYQLVAEHDVAFGAGFETIPVEISQSYTSIFRVVPVGKNGTVGAEFTNIVVNPVKIFKRRTYVSISTRVVNNGVSVDITDLPHDVESFVIMRRDATIRETFKAIGDEVVFVKTENSSQSYSVIDTSLKQNYVYEYTCRLIYRNGHTFDAGRAFITYEQLVENLVDTRFENVSSEVSVDNLNVTFKMKTILNESNVDSIKKLLERQGLKDLFAADLLLERDKLQSLIAHQVYRVNLTEGIKESFGIITSEDFSDNALRLINSVAALKPGNTYRYEVIALLRTPETMFEEFVKTSVDKTTKKPYSFKPSKFLHPVTLKNGNITSPQSLIEHYSQEQFSFGSVGNLATTEVSFANSLVSVTNANAEKFDPKTIAITWAINGMASQIDHFIIMKEYLGQRHVIGKSHALETVGTSTFRFLHALSTSDIGEPVYIITPVFDTYDVGHEVKTNKVVIE